MDQMVVERTADVEKEFVDQGHNRTNVEGDVLLNSDLRNLEAYLSSTYIWSRFSDLARSSPVTRVVPGMGDAWSRALRKARKSGAVFESNIFHDHGRDLWSWADAFGHRRHSARYAFS